MLGGILKVAEKILRRDKIPKQITHSHETDRVEKQNGEGFFEKIAGVFFLFVADIFANFKQLGLDEIPINHAKNGLRTAPRAPNSTREGGDEKNGQKKQDQNEGQEVKFLGVESDEKKMEFFVVKAQEEEVIVVDFDEGQDENEKG